VIRAQQAFVRHTRGKAKEAMEIYEEVLKSPVSDVSVSAVCNNNIVALNKDQDKFNSFNRLKHLGAEAVQDKLSTAQKRAIVLNRCVLLLLMNKADECREQLKLFEAEFPNSEYAPIILSSLQFRDRKVQKAEQILKVRCTAVTLPYCLYADLPCSRTPHPSRTYRTGSKPTPRTALAFNSHLRNSTCRKTTFLLWLKRSKALSRCDTPQP
jgi:hypothetical protein